MVKKEEAEENKRKKRKVKERLVQDETGVEKYKQKCEKKMKREENKCKERRVKERLAQDERCEREEM